jgi:hypothetical protein
MILSQAFLLRAQRAALRNYAIVVLHQAFFASTASCVAQVFEFGSLYLCELRNLWGGEGGKKLFPSSFELLIAFPKQDVTPRENPLHNAINFFGMYKKCN